jgi:NAD(P)-dependent dehydrogenase (short-subunit alcohol dehydrogenase family)
MARAAAIAFAGEGADVAINYLPAEEPDAREVVGFHKGTGKAACKTGYSRQRCGSRPDMDAASGDWRPIAAKNS